MSPLVGRYRPSSRRPKVVLPEPVSPTSASVSPRRMASETPSTALSVARARPVADHLVPARPAEKCFETSAVSMIGVAVLARSLIEPPAGAPLSAAPPVVPPVVPPPAALPLAAVIGIPRSDVRGQRVPAGVRAPVHLEDGAGDIGGGIRGEEEHRLGDIPRIPGPAERDGADQRRPQVLRRAVRVGVAPVAHVEVAGGD